MLTPTVIRTLATVTALRCATERMAGVAYRGYIGARFICVAIALRAVGGLRVPK